MIPSPGPSTPLSDSAIRQILAGLLLVLVLGIDSWSGAGRGAPISWEMASGNPWASRTLLVFGVLLGNYASTCRRLGWYALHWWALALLPLLLAIAVTDPSTPFHLGAFFALLLLGIPWMIVYADRDCQRPLAILACLMLLSSLVLFFILAITSIAADVQGISPVGIVQRSFLFLFAIMGLARRDVVIVEEGAGHQHPAIRFD